MFYSSPPLSASALLAFPLLVSAPAIGLAHDAKSGWSYPYACCSGIDCREVQATVIRERPEGFVIGLTGEVVGYTDKRIRNSPDGEYHWCSVAGRDDGRTICLFVPPRSF